MAKFITSLIGSPMNFAGYVVPPSGIIQLEDEAYTAIAKEPVYQSMVESGHIIESDSAPEGVTPYFMGTLDPAAQAQYDVTKGENVPQAASVQDAPLVNDDALSGGKKKPKTDAS